MPVYTDDDELMHYGILRRSGRYPWGSGKDPHQRSLMFKDWYDDLKKQRLTHAQIAESLGLKDKYGNNEFTSTQLRYVIAKSSETIRDYNIARARALKAKDMSTTAIAEQMGLGKSGESTVRGWLAASEKVKADSITATANTLKAELATKPLLDVGKGTHLHMNITEAKLKTALIALQDEGYDIFHFKRPQLGTGEMTNYKILVQKGIDKARAKLGLDRGELQVVGSQSDDGGISWTRPQSKLPESVDLKRIEVNWAENGGATKDGVIELRRGVEDISLGESRYAQVRVAVNGTHYLKGMAMYADDLPAGIDIRFNTNKKQSDTDGKLGAMKEMKRSKETGDIDADMPFGASVFQRTYTDKNGKTKTSALNIVNEEGNWDDWSRNLSSQMLSKQSLSFAQKQLNKAYDEQRKDLDTINSLTNPVVRQKLLNEFADSADAAAVHLKAAAVDRQATRVILPINSMKRNEIYAPNFENGEKVALVRHPHGGPFEIPQLTVNNNNREAKRILGNSARDAVGIHHSVAEQLSGADFDGDTVLVIPNSNRAIKFKDPLPGLKGFDPKVQYSIPKDDTTTPRMTKKQTQIEMGKISNLITDMTIRGANETQIAAAVRHSMVVIDAEKHGLNYRQSELDNNIKSLKAEFQGKSNAGASTIISRIGKDVKVPQFKERGIDPKTGEKIRVETGAKSYETKFNKETGKYERTGKLIDRTTNVKLGAYVKDARELLSKNPTPMEELYAAHSNSMKALANEARKASVAIKPPKKSAAAEHFYAKEVASLDAKLKLAERNAPIERRAQIIGNAMARARIESNPGLDKDDEKKIKYKALEDARNYTGAGKIRIGAKDPKTGRSTLTDREWEAIQSHAISPTKLRSILANADMDRVKELSSPRARTSLTPGQMARAKALMATGNHSLSEIAARLGVPRSTLSDNLKNG